MARREAGRTGLRLVFGASGYVGRHLTPQLAAAGLPVRAAARRLAPLVAEGWRGVGLVAADALRPETLRPALAGVDVAYYLVHSMAGGRGFAERDRRAAAAFAEAAAEAGVRRIVYLGGLAPANADTAHLASRVETGDILRRGPVPVTELRAGIIVGPGSAAFEVMRDLVAHLPAMVTPRWVRVASPPVALDDLLDDLVALPDLPGTAGAVFETGGPERLTYEQMMRRLARALGRRDLLILPVPFLTPTLSAYWLDLVTSVPAPIARALIGGLRHDLTADDRALRAVLPRACMGFDAAVERALERERGIVSTDRWREGAFDLRGGRHERSFYGKRMTRAVDAGASPGAVWGALGALGTPDAGHFFVEPVWRLRAWADRRLGGDQAPPRARGSFAVGDRFGFWRVHAVAPGARLTLVSTLRAPGCGGLEIEIERPERQADPGARVVATIHWHPDGVWGLLYWFALWLPHAVMLRGFVRALALKAGRPSAYDRIS